jgi:DNA-binding MarR family transcriptional regulator
VKRRSRARATPRKHTSEHLLDQVADNWPEAITATSELMIRVNRLSDIVRQNARRQISRYGLTFTEFEVLSTLRSGPPPHEMAPTELCTTISISSGGLTKVLRGLGSRDLTSRPKSSTDARSMPVRLTAEGRRVAEQMMAEVLNADESILAKALSTGELVNLTALIRKLLINLEGDD